MCSAARIDVKDSTEKVNSTSVAQVSPVRHGRRRKCANPTATDVSTAPDRCTAICPRRAPNACNSRFNRDIPKNVTKIPNARMTKPSKMIAGEIDNSKAGCT